MFDYEELDGEEYGLMGRWFDYEHSDGNTYKATITPGAEMFFKVSGTTSVNFKLNCNANLQDVPYVAVSVDGSAPERVRTHRTNAVTVVTGLDAEKEHYIRIIVDSFSSAQGSRWTAGNGLIFDKITVDAGGEITGLMPKNPVIAYYGDSITEGLAALSTEGQGLFTTSSSAINAYPFTASHLIGAVSHTSGYGSTGITIEKGLGNVPDCITVIDNMIQDTPIVMPELDAIVVNHGHNDLNMSVPDAEFAEGYKQVLVRLREKHPDTAIFAVVPYAQRYVETIKNVVEELDDDNIYYISTADWKYTTTDGVHPDAAGGKALGTRLAEEIGKVLGLG
jgi:lysophospholipase L1-like esterase